VRDHGRGLPAGLAPRVFEPHIRGASGFAGAGLGLSIAKGIVEAHGGRLTTRPVGHGCAFVVALPTEPTDASAGTNGAAWNVIHDTEETSVL
jgi:signal transduction histidine kinase